MRLISFNPFRTLDIPGTLYIKPELVFRHKDELRQADWVLFPETWQINFLAYGLKKRLYPSINTYHLGYNKVEMTRAFWAVAPEHVPHTLILPSNDNALAQILDELTFPMVAKEIRSSMGRGVFLLRERADLLSYARQAEVLYLQEYLPIRRDLRVVFVGDRVIGSYWRVGAEGAFLNNLAQGGELSFADIPNEALRLVEQVAADLGINHAGFDLAEFDGHFFLLEFNPLFGTEGLCRQGISVGKAIWDYLCRLTPASPGEPDRPLISRAG